MNSAVSAIINEIDRMIISPTNIDDIAHKQFSEIDPLFLNIIANDQEDIYLSFSSNLEELWSNIVTVITSHIKYEILEKTSILKFSFETGKSQEMQKNFESAIMNDFNLMNQNCYNDEIINFRSINNSEYLEFSNKSSEESHRDRLLLELITNKFVTCIKDQLHKTKLMLIFLAILTDVGKQVLSSSFLESIIKRIQPQVNSLRYNL